jgi:hypothetical protein
MINSNRKTDVPASGGRKLCSVGDASLVSMLRREAEAVGVDWRSDPLGPSVIQRASDLLFPSSSKCGESRAYRIQSLVQSLPEELPEDLNAAPEVQENDRSPEPPAEDTAAPEPEDDRSPEGGEPEEWGGVAGASGAARFRRFWRRDSSRSAEGIAPEVDDESSGRPERAWPILLIAASAFCALWAGWVGLGKMTGFGAVVPLPGIVNWTADASITLPLGVEALAGYAIRAWLSGYGTPSTRRLARRTAIGCLILGAVGQAAYHLMKVAEVGADGAPWQVTTLVSIIPVASIGMASALQHRLAMDRRAHKARLRKAAQNV